MATRHVFPAFDTNYRARKRTFACCDVCRLKRIKCNLSATAGGCVKCSELKVVCSLLKRDVTKKTKIDKVESKPVVKPIQVKTETPAKVLGEGKSGGDEPSVKKMEEMDSFDSDKSSPGFIGILPISMDDDFIEKSPVRSSVSSSIMGSLDSPRSRPQVGPPRSVASSSTGSSSSLSGFPERGLPVSFVDKSAPSPTTSSTSYHKEKLHESSPGNPSINSPGTNLGSLWEHVKPFKGLFGSDEPVLESMPQGMPQKFSSQAGSLYGYGVYQQIPSFKAAFYSKNNPTFLSNQSYMSRPNWPQNSTILGKGNGWTSGNPPYKLEEEEQADDLENRLEDKLHDKLTKLNERQEVLESNRAFGTKKDLCLNSQETENEKNGHVKSFGYNGDLFNQFEKYGTNRNTNSLEKIRDKFEQNTNSLEKYGTDRKNTNSLEIRDKFEQNTSQFEWGKTNGKKTNRKDDSPLIDTVYEEERNVTDPSLITPQHLRDRFGFNVSGHTAGESYSFVFHGHPKSIITNAVNGESMWNGFGYYFKSDLGLKYSQHRQASGRPESTGIFHITSLRTYRALLEMWVFTLSSHKYRFSHRQTEQLLKIFFAKTNSVFPLVHERSFWSDFHGGCNQSALTYSMVLVVLREELARPILSQVFARAGRDPSTFDDDRLEVMADIEAKIRQVVLILPQLGDNDRFQRMVVSLILSLHNNFSTYGSEANAHDLTDAINFAVSLGIHIKDLYFILKEEEKSRYSANVWWCCFIFDRFSSMVNQRCLFIKTEDFNLDLPKDNPNLMRLVKLAKDIEDMSYAIHRPFQTDDADKEKRFSEFDAETFTKTELELCKRERAGVPAMDYPTRATHLLERICNNMVIISIQKVNYDDVRVPIGVPENNALSASENILHYINSVTDEDIIHLPLVPWSVSVATAIMLKRVAMCYTAQSDNSVEETTKDFERFIKTLERFVPTWFIADETYSFSRGFLNKM